MKNDWDWDWDWWCPCWGHFYAETLKSLSQGVWRNNPSLNNNKVHIEGNQSPSQSLSSHLKKSQSLSVLVFLWLKKPKERQGEGHMFRAKSEYL